MLKLEIGTVTIPEGRTYDEEFSYAAYHCRRALLPGTYPVFAYLEWTGDGGGMWALRGLSALAQGRVLTCHAGPTVRVGDVGDVWLRLATYGVVGELAGAADVAPYAPTLHEAIERHEWAPDDHAPMWRYVWSRAWGPKTLERARYSGGTDIAVPQLRATAGGV